ncbi:MAG: 5'-deoxynucleotidase [Oscillospiraceae bacterium]|nr:5'-deoxynucleotidase [Oscillospiraceae bacterium]
MAYGFSALLARMSYINRWGLMRGGRYETLSEHSLSVASTAHLLACIANAEYGAGVRPEKVACCAMYHDASEILTGDLPTPVKYKNESIRAEYKRIEREAEQTIAAMLPPSVRGELGSYVTGEALTQRERRIIKSADKLSALVKCIEEENGGNKEFESAKRSTLAWLADDPLPETRYFIEHCVPAYSLTLDELLASAEK